MDKLWKRPTTAAEVAASSCDEDSFGRHLRDWQHELRKVSSRNGFAHRIQTAPPLLRRTLNDHGQCDAYLAAYVEWLCERHGVQVPKWVGETERIAGKAWFDYPPLWQDAFVHAPAAFRRHGVFTRPDDVLKFRSGRPVVSDTEKRSKAAQRQRRYRERIRAKLERLDAMQADTARTGLNP